MVTGITSTGFEFRLDEGRIATQKYLRISKRMKDAEKVRGMNGEIAPEAAAGIAFDMVEMEEFILGEDQLEALEKHCDGMAVSGMASGADVAAEFNEILSIAAEKSRAVKNS